MYLIQFCWSGQLKFHVISELKQEKARYLQGTESGSEWLESTTGMVRGCLH